MAINTLFSKHKVMIPVSTVELQGKPAGTYLFFLLGLICCNPCSMPTGVVVLIKCTVWTGFKVGDLLKGLAYIALDAAFDLVWNRVFKGSWMGESVKENVLLAMPKIAEPAATQVLGGLTLREMVFWGGSGLVGRWILTQSASKAIDHVLKSWVASPVITGTARGAPSIGRGPYSYKFFDAHWW
jgi:hypothetical protein